MIQSYMLRYACIATNTMPLILHNLMTLLNTPTFSETREIVYLIQDINLVAIEDLIILVTMGLNMEIQSDSKEMVVKIIEVKAEIVGKVRMERLVLV